MSGPTELSREELLALGDAARCPLVDAQEQAWADALSDDERALAVARGREQLARRGLLADDGRPGPQLHALMRVRSDPALIAVLGQPGREAREAPRAYGVAGPDGALDALLVERAGPDGSTFTQVPLEVAVEQVAAWLAGEQAASRIASALGPPERVVRTLEVLHPVPGSGPARSRVAVVSGPGGTARCEVGADGALLPPQACDADEVRAEVRVALSPLGAR